MHEEGTQRSQGAVLYLVISGAPEGIPSLIKLCQAVGWHVMVFSTPDGARFIDRGELEELTGEPVRSEYRMPGTGKSTPPADAVLACPLTFNSVNKFANGHADNFAVGLLRDGRVRRTRRGRPTLQAPAGQPPPRSPRAWPRCAAWASKCCSTPALPTSAGCRRGKTSLPRSLS